MTPFWITHWPDLVVLGIGAYLAGSISSAVVVCSLLGYPDPRDSGSGNPGATNVLRVAGKAAAALTLAGDILKGILPVLIARLVGLPPLIVAVIGLLAVIGHVYPIFFEFRGGKGIATAFGLIFIISWVVGLITAAIWLATFLIGRISSVASLLAFLVMPVLMYWQAPVAFWPLLALTLLVFWRHRSNIGRLLQGEEGSFRSTKG